MRLPADFLANYIAAAASAAALCIDLQQAHHQQLLWTNKQHSTADISIKCNYRFSCLSYAKNNLAIVNAGAQAADNFSSPLLFIAIGHGFNVIGS